MEKQFALTFVFVGLAAAVVCGVSVVKADTTIYIRPNGTIEGTNLITSNGDTYTFTTDITWPIHIEKNSIVLDGAGYTLEGHKESDAINLTCTDVVVKNLRIRDWDTGILGAYDNNVITGNVISGCDYGVKIYANNYKITENTLTRNEEGIRLHGGNNAITNNSITGNRIGIYFQGYASNRENVVKGNTIANNDYGIYIFVNTFGVQQKICQNNFIQNTRHVANIGTSLTEYIPMKTSNWDNASEGNYWSDYNGTDTNGDGIGDTPYSIDTANTDNYPLMQPFKTPVFSPWPSLTQNPTLQPTPTQTLTATETPNPTPANSAQPPQSPQPQTTSAVPTEVALALTASIAINIILTLLLFYKKKLN